MPYLELEISSQPVELNGDEEITLTFSINDIRRLDRREGGASRRFRVPATPKNKRLFGFPERGEVLQPRFRPRKQPCILRADGAIVVEGSARLCGYTEENGLGFYELEILTDNADWADTLRDRMLHELDLSDMDHLYEVAPIKDSWAGDKPYVYPLIDYGLFESYTDTSPLAVRDWLPAVFIKYLVDRIFTTLDYQVGGPFWEDLQHRSLILPYTNSGFSHSTAWGERRLATAGKSAAQSAGGGGVPVLLTFDSTEGNAAGLWDNTPGIHRFTADEGMLLNIKLRTQQAATITQYDLFLNGGLYGSYTSASADVSTEWTLWLDAGDYVEMYFRNPGSLVQWAELTLEPLLDYRQGSTLEGSTLVPQNFRQLDLLRGLYQMFGLYVETDVAARTVNFYTFEQYYNRAGEQPADWTDKLDSDAGLEIIMDSGALARRNYFRFRDDPNDHFIQSYNQTYRDRPPYGDGILYGPADAAEAEKVIADLPFACTWMGDSFSGRLHLPKIPLVSIVDGEVKFTGKVEVRVLVYGGMQPVSVMSQLTMSMLTFDGIMGYIPYAYSWKKRYQTPLSDLDYFDTTILFNSIINELSNSIIAKYYNAIDAIGNGTLVKVTFMQSTFADYQLGNNKIMIRPYFAYLNKYNLAISVTHIKLDAELLLDNSF